MTYLKPFLRSLQTGLGSGTWLVGAVMIAYADLACWFLDLILANQSKAIEEPIPMLMSIGIRVYLRQE